ncbi:3025_t:CDS:2 [Acaulospora morrowiae]|uniref:40S ribosomal protein S7 n=1 Tax=Acaulospora morrowiae TaxID=94023 RepID=A0A9N9EI29_9GLOM|nr:3025_t:CDS:2 [Acaulospora morrowiae]
MADKKIAKRPGSLTTDETTEQIAQAIYDLESNVAELKKDLKIFQITSAKEVCHCLFCQPESCNAMQSIPGAINSLANNNLQHFIKCEVVGGKKAIVISVPVPLLKQYQHNNNKILQRLTRELEKKFSDRHIVFIADRRILRKPGRRSRIKQPRPRSRTLTHVHEKYLEDLVYPTEIVGKRTRVKVDGSKIIKVFLDSKDATSLEYKLDTFKSVYKYLTGKDVEFQFPAHQLE